MAVYLKDAKVLLDNGMVAVDPNCCCGCPTSITFSGIEFCCSCTGDSSTLIQFFEDPDFAVLNGVAWPLPLDAPFGSCPQVCFNDDVPLFFRVGESGCPTGSEDPAGPASLSIFVALISGVWYVMIYVAANFLLFYGSSADPSSIPNSLTDCTTTIDTFDNPMLDCIHGGPDDNLCVNAKNGTAVLTF